MISVNLLPSSYRKKIKSIYIQRLIFFIAGCLILVLISLSILLYYLNFYLKIRLDAFPLVYQEKIEKWEKETSLYKRQIEFIEKIKLTHLSETLEKIRELTPSGVSWRNLQIEEGKISFRGYAQTREQMLEFEKTLKEHFPKVEGPLSNLTKPTDLEFTLIISYENN
jgi:hypothetical protein